MPSRSLALAAAALTLGACVVAPMRPPPPPRMSGDEAARDGLAYCRSRGFACALVSVQPRGPLWLVELDASAPRAAGRMHVEFDMRDRRLLRADEPRPPPQPAPPRAMNSDEATRHGMEYCASRGYACRLLDAALVGDHLWRLNYEVGGRYVGRLHLELDAFTRALVNVSENVRAAY